MMVESSKSRDSTAWAINASYDGLVYDGGANVSKKAIDILNSSSIRGFILGRSGTDAVGSVGGFDGMKNFILGGGVPSATAPGAPIAFKFKNLVDNSDVKIVLSSEYTVRECDNVGEVVDAPGLSAEIFECGQPFKGIDSEGIAHDGVEFNGNGPEVIGKFWLDIENATQVYLHIDVMWTETAENRSRAIASSKKLVYTAPPGKTLGAFPDLTYAEFSYIDKTTDKIDVEGTDLNLTGGTFIQNLRVVGDSDGEDMDCSPDHDCNVRFYLKSFKVSLKSL